jgi:hypothetical protein
VPIWKRETWANGREWALDPHPLAEFDVVADGDERQVSP